MDDVLINDEVELPPLMLEEVFFNSYSGKVYGDCPSCGRRVGITRKHVVKHMREVLTDYEDIKAEQKADREAIRAADRELRAMKRRVLRRFPVGKIRATITALTTILDEAEKLNERLVGSGVEEEQK